jgi:ABC-2 type transport system ATP-binding protein
MNTSIIQTNHLCRRFGDITALKDVSLDIPAGSIFGYLGLNGAGKTTTIRILLGLLPPTSGKVSVLGLDPATHAAEIRAHSGALLEHTGLYERLSAWENLDFYGRIWHITAPQRGRRIQELLESIGLWERRSESIQDWSRGMKQKLAVARALIHRPELVFLDEPSAGLDPLAAVSLREDLQRLVNHEKVTVFLTTHRLDEAEKLCSQVAILHNGVLLAGGSPEEIKQQTGKAGLEEAFISLVREPEWNK